MGLSSIHWVRHGPTHQTTFTGWRDVPADLSDTDTLERLAAFLPNDALIVSSDLQRAVQTADAIAGGRHRLPHLPELREFNFGEWDGRHNDDIATRDPTLSRAFWRQPGDLAPPGGESWNTVATRVAAAIDGLGHAHPGRPLVAVAHFGTILTHLSTAGGLPATEALTHKIAPLSVTELARGEDGWTIERINHLP